MNPDTLDFADIEPSPAHVVLAEVEQERARQDDKWGEQNHPDLGITSRPAHFEAGANDWKHINASRVAGNRLAWDGILLEEVYEALAEEDPAKLRAELIQVAAVAAAWVECIDRRAYPSSDEAGQ